MSSKLILAAPLAMLVGGCTSLNQPNGPPDPAFGESVKYNAAVQTIDPDPVYGPDDSQPGSNGAKGVAAMKRYRTDAVKEVEVIKTTSGSGPQ